MASKLHPTIVSRLHACANLKTGLEPAMKATWKHHEDNKALDAKERNELPASVYAFPDKRKEPLTNASHVRNAIARFDQVKDVTDQEREQAFANIKAAAKHYGVEMTETSWHDLGKKPHTAGHTHRS
jgi:hypothetical protein